MPDDVAIASRTDRPAGRFSRIRGRLILLACALALAGVFVLGIHPFLAITDPIPTKVMVVEGWIPDYAIEEALKAYRRDGYDQIYTTGGPLELGSYLSAHRDFAHLAAATFERLGLPPGKVQAVPSAVKHRNRTYSSALALKEFFASQGIRIHSMNLVTEGTHSRRSRLCFRRALGRETAVGVISIENRDYPSNQWWRYSSGVKTILGESLALMYAWTSIDYGD